MILLLIGFGVLAGFSGVASAALIGEVLRSGGASGDQPDPTQEGGWTDGNFCFSDRGYTWANTPPKIDGAECVQTFNNDTDVPNPTYTVTFPEGATALLTCDDRYGDLQAEVDSVVSAFAAPGTFTDTGWDVFVGGDGPDPGRQLSVFSAVLGPGTYVFGPPGTPLHNMYVIGALDSPQALNPNPADGALHSNTWVSLSWRPGPYAVSHDVYFGDNFDDVNAGTGDTFQGNQTVTQFRVGSYRGYPSLPDLVAGTTYYWRIDEVNDAEPNSPWKGKVWNFMTPSETVYDPYPADGANFFVDPNVVLRWTAGFGANVHQVYFGDHFAHVRDADTSDTTGIYRGTQAATTYTPGPLRLDSLYYWRVDEVPAGRGSKTHKGDVWSFTTAPPIAITDPNLLCWWMFNEAEGTTAIDYSGHNHYGTVNGATWVANGQVGGALDFGGDGDHVVDEDAENYLNGLDALTVCMWIKSNVVNTDKGFITCEQPDNSDHIITMRYDASGARDGGTNLLKMAVIAPNNQQQLESSSNLQTTEWQHVCMTWSTGQQLGFYVNGVEDTPQNNSEPSYVTTSGVTTLIIGKGGKDISGGWDGMIDDVRIYNIVLSDAEIYALGTPSGAWAPSPSDGATVGTQTPTLRWTAGGRAFQHDVYFGTDEEGVRNANMRSPEYKDTKGLGFESYDPGRLEWNTTYYWRVDQYNTDETVSEGNVWSFTVVMITNPLPEALDTDLSFTTGGSANWFGQAATYYHDGDAAQSGDISDGQDSWIQTTVSGTGTVKFYWKVSSEEDFDFLEFYIDGSLQDKISGSVDWQQKTYTITTSDSHALEWRYVKDDSEDSGSDAGWIDDIDFSNE